LAEGQEAYNLLPGRKAPIALPFTISSAHAQQCKKVDVATDQIVRRRDPGDMVQKSAPPVKELPEFSLVVGGPLFQLLRRTSLSGIALQFLRRRIVVLTALAWLPLLVLSIVEGTAWGTRVPLPFLHDIELHVRLLLAIPLLIFAEIAVHRRMHPVVMQFVERGLIPESARAEFDAAIASALRLRNSVMIEALLVALVYVVGVGILWRTQTVVDVASWHGTAVNGTWRPTMAGWWLGCVSLPMFQFLLLRWYFRLCIWGRFLWKVSRIDLKLMPTHPDRCGGLSFLSYVCQAFAPLLLAQGAVLAGMMANRIFFAGATLPQFKAELIGLVIIMIFAVLGPLLVFTPQLAAVKRIGQFKYGALAQRYVRDYDYKWLRGGAPPDEPFLGSADIQSLADLANSFEVVKDMKLVPFTLSTLVQLAVTTLLPLLPLVLTMISAEELIGRLVSIMF
jgi:hypothetical protein